jgi:hypothetical protein
VAMGIIETPNQLRRQVGRKTMRDLPLKDFEKLLWGKQSKSLMGPCAGFSRRRVRVDRRAGLRDATGCAIGRIGSGLTNGLVGGLAAWLPGAQRLGMPC